MIQDLTELELDGHKLQALREAKGLTQRQVGQAIGVSTVTVSSYENGHGKPSGDILARLMVLYGVTSPDAISSGADAPVGPL